MFVCLFLTFLAELRENSYITAKTMKLSELIGNGTGILPLNFGQI